MRNPRKSSAASRTGLVALAVVLFGVLATQAQTSSKADATVVFFTPGGHWRGMGGKLNPFAGKAKTISNGAVFDGDTLLATLTHSRYISMRLPAGIHALSASRLGDHANPKESITLDLKPRSVTYFAITTTVPSLAAGFSPFETSHIKNVTCKDFRDDHDVDASEPLQMDHVETAYRGSVDDPFDIGLCQQ